MKNGTKRFSEKELLRMIEDRDVAIERANTQRDEAEARADKLAVLLREAGSVRRRVDPQAGVALALVASQRAVLDAVEAVIRAATGGQEGEQNV